MAALAVPQLAVSGITAASGVPPRSARPGNCPETACRTAGTGTIGTMTTAPAYDNGVRIGYARVSTRAQGALGPARRARRGAPRR